MDTRDDKNTELNDRDSSADVGGGNGALRIYWMAIGNVILLIVAGFISKQPIWTLTVLDACYVLIMLTLLAARWVDVKRYGGETANGEPATSTHLIKYGVGVAAASAALWGLVQSVSA